MKKILFFLFLSINLKAQVITQIYTDPCDLKVYTITIPINNKGVTVIIRDKVKIFSYKDFENGVVDNWVKTIFSTPCPNNQIVQQSVQQAVSQSISSMSQNISNSSGVTETISNDNSSTNTNSESSSKSNESKKENNSGDKKKKEKSNNTNPMLLSSDLAVTQNMDMRFNAMLSLGLSKSSLMGDKSYSTSILIWSNLKQFAWNTGLSKLNIKNGKINSISSYSTTFGYLEGILMNSSGYTYVKPNSKYGTYGYNSSFVSIYDENLNFSNSNVFFITKTFQYNKKTSFSPQLFIIVTPINYNTKNNNLKFSLIPTLLAGCNYDLKLSKKFGLNLSYKSNIIIQPKITILNNFQIGSKLVF